MAIESRLRECNTQAYVEPAGDFLLRTGHEVLKPLHDQPLHDQRRPSSYAAYGMVELCLQYQLTGNRLVNVPTTITERDSLVNIFTIYMLHFALWDWPG